MKPKEAFNKFWKALLVYGLMAIATWWTFVVGRSFVNLCVVIYTRLGPSVLLEGAYLVYVAVLAMVMIMMYIHIRTYPHTSVTPQILLARKVVMTWGFIPVLNMLIPLFFLGWAIFQIGVKGAAYIIVLFEEVYGDGKQSGGQ